MLWAGMLLLTGQFTVFYWLTWCEAKPSRACLLYVTHHRAMLMLQHWAAQSMPR